MLKSIESFFKHLSCLKGLRQALWGLCLLALWGCDNMRDDNRYKPYEESSFFKNQSLHRDPLEGTVARGQLRSNDHLYRGKLDNKTAETFPFEVTPQVLKRGEERYNIYCSVCHDRLGYGQGMVVQRGFKTPPAFHEERLQKAPVGYFFEVMTQGFGEMAPYAAEVTPEDRWAIAAWIRTLQESQNVPSSEIPASILKQLEEGHTPQTDKGTTAHAKH